MAGAGPSANNAWTAPGLVRKTSRYPKGELRKPCTGVHRNCAELSSWPRSSPFSFQRFNISISTRTVLTDLDQINAGLSWNADYVRRIIEKSK
jgi:hypothetical protein